MIYVIGEEGTRRVKIGYTKNIKRRLRDLQQGNSRQLTLLYMYSGDLQFEKHIHKELRSQELRPEWYPWTPRVKTTFLEATRTFKLRPKQQNSVIPLWVEALRTGRVERVHKGPGWKGYTWVGGKKIYTSSHTKEGVYKQFRKLEEWAQLYGFEEMMRRKYEERFRNSIKPIAMYKYITPKREHYGSYKRGYRWEGIVWIRGLRYRLRAPTRRKLIKKIHAEQRRKIGT